MTRTYQEGQPVFVLGEEFGLYTVIKAVYRGITQEGWYQVEIDGGVRLSEVPSTVVFSHHDEAVRQLRFILERSLQQITNEVRMTMLQMPLTGELVEQGGPEDRATWLICGYCSFNGPHVGYTEEGKPACMGSCGGVKANPKVPRLPHGKSYDVKSLSRQQLVRLFENFLNAIAREAEQCLDEA